jgi:hypothetical protein
MQTCESLREKLQNSEQQTMDERNNSSSSGHCEDPEPSWPVFPLDLSKKSIQILEGILKPDTNPINQSEELLPIPSLDVGSSVTAPGQLGDDPGQTAIILRGSTTARAPLDYPPGVWTVGAMTVEQALVTPEFDENYDTNELPTLSNCKTEDVSAEECHPPGLEQIGVDAWGAPLCYFYNFGTCPVSGLYCSHGRHDCMRKYCVALADVDPSEYQQHPLHKCGTVISRGAGDTEFCDQYSNTGVCKRECCQLLHYCNHLHCNTAHAGSKHFEKLLKQLQARSSRSDR